MNSMTGMGIAKASLKGIPWVVEIKSVNHKFCDVSVKGPSFLQIFEPLFAQTVRKKIQRGKIDIWIGIEKKSSDLAIDEKSLKSYHKLLTKVAKDLNIKEKPTLTHLMMGVQYWMPREKDAEVDADFFVGLIEKALVSLAKMRQHEGRALKDVLISRRKKLESVVAEINDRRQLVVDSCRQRLQKKIEELLNGVGLDEARLENEIAYILDRTDISEELDRLGAHFKQFDKMLQSTEPVGRSLDFLIQEFNRELNTITSKSQDAAASHLVVTGKSELEKIREQIQNIE